MSSGNVPKRPVGDAAKKVTRKMSVTQSSVLSVTGLVITLTRVGFVSSAAAEDIWQRLAGRHSVTFVRNMVTPKIDALGS